MRTLTKILLLLIPTLLAASCGNKPKKSYTFKGEVILDNRCNLSVTELPERIKVTYTLYGKEKNLSAEQLVDVHALEPTSGKAVFNMTVSTDIDPTDYAAMVTRPNGTNICTMLPCPNGRSCKGENRKEKVSLGERTSVTDTLRFTCSCSY